MVMSFSAMNMVGNHAQDLHYFNAEDSTMPGGIFLKTVLVTDETISCSKRQNKLTSSACIRIPFKIPATHGK
jgi:hypothetical protein